MKEIEKIIERINDKLDKIKDDLVLINKKIGND